MIDILVRVMLLLGVFSYLRSPMAWAIFKMVLAVPISPLLALLLLVAPKTFLKVMTALWVHLDIYTPEGELYLRRFFMTPKTKWYCPRFLHYIRLSDVGRDPHDHPGKFNTTILKGGYNESVFFPRVKFADNFGRLSHPLVIFARPGKTLRNPVGHTHMVELIAPTWSWVKGWIKGVPWGFWVLDPTEPSKDKWIDSNAYGAKGKELYSWEK